MISDYVADPPEQHNIFINPPHLLSVLPQMKVNIM